MEGKDVYIEFEGVNSSATVIINQQTVGTHDGGYSAFCFDITPYLLEKNVIEVLVDNRPNEYVYPQRADFTFYGGIYRDVNLILVDETHIQLDCYGSRGIKISPKITGGDAMVKV